jgi:hypothetical protein
MKKIPPGKKEKNNSTWKKMKNERMTANDYM